MIEFDEHEEYVEPLRSTLIQISDDGGSGSEYYVGLNDIGGIKKVYSHPNDSNDKKGFPKYQVFMRNGVWSWVLITMDEFKKYVKPYINKL